jgi:hypothetical protein
MRTEQTVFNIIWLDDEIDTLYNRHKKELLDDGIKVLDKGAHNVEEFEQQIQKHRNFVDAVVTDANLNLKVKDDFDGLIDVSYLIKKYNKERSIPFIVFTGRDNIFEKVHNKTIGQFDAIISKQDERGIEALISMIKNIVLKVNSKEFRIHNKYRKEIEAASLIPGNKESLINALLYEYSEDWENTKDYFNPMRKIADSIFSACKREGIIPDVGDLNKISTFLDKNNHETYSITEEIMPKPLARALWYFLDITQDASHDKDGLRLKVSEYVRENQNINLFRSVLYIAMDLCLWYQKCKEEMNSSDYHRKWERRDNINSSENTKEERHLQHYEYEGVVKKDAATGRYYCENFLLDNPKDGRYQEGDRIRILNSTDNKWTFVSEEENEVDRFVFLSNIKKI